MARTPRTLAAVVVLLIGSALMFGGRRFWAWAANEPTADERLLAAVADGDMAALQDAIDDGASIEARTSTGATALAVAARESNVELVSFLLARGADVSASFYEGNSVLAFATYSDSSYETVRRLLEAGADPNGEPGGLSPPLVMASAGGNVASVRLLLAAGADANQCGHGKNRATPLTAAATGTADETVIRCLIEGGADVNRPDEEGQTPLQVATAEGHTSLVLLLKQAGAVR